MAYAKTPCEERFWKYVAKSSGCWLWTGCKTARGYGNFYLGIAPNGKKKYVTAHRFSFELHNGPLDDFLCLHTCDTPLCVRPDHLFRGTGQDNVTDSIAKGRRVQQGIYNAANKLSETQVQLIRLYGKNKWQHRKIAEHFCVGKTTITYILSGKAWKHLEASA